jgi:hypothetical protein
MFVVQDVETQTQTLPGGILVKPVPRMVCIKFRKGDGDEADELSVMFDHATVREGACGVLTYELTLGNVMHYGSGDIQGRDLGTPSDEQFHEILGRWLAGTVIGH